MPAREVILWAVDEVVAGGQELRWPDRATDVFYRDLQPKPGSLMLGISTASTDAGDHAFAVVLVA